MKTIVLLLSLFATSVSGLCQENPIITGQQNTWTYTYLKAKDNQRDNLKEYILQNWFVMDSIAVQNGLFNDYRLFSNVASETNSDWDFVVAVEYFTTGTYADIAEEWETIRSNHQIIPIKGYSFSELGMVIRSENLKLELATK